MAKSRQSAPTLTRTTALQAPARPPRLALLIDADNISPTAAAPLVEAAARRGRLAIRRAYGDWTTPNLTGWKACLHVHAIQPVQQFAYSAGKNATDGALIIDAMDLFYTADLDGFCIVSSDSDFTRLATRLREAGKLVYGFGERKTNKAFVAACDQFTWIEDLHANAKTIVRGQRRPGPSGSPAPKRPPLAGPELNALLTRAVMAAGNGTGWVSLSLVGQHIREIQPDFDPRAYKAKSLKELVSQLGYLRCQCVPDALGSKRFHLEVRLASEIAPVAAGSRAAA